LPNVALVHKDRISSFRRLALGTWLTTKDPTVYGTLCLEVDKALDYIDEYRAKTGRRLTLTHLMARVVGRLLVEMPDANAIVRFGRIYLRQEASVFFQVAMEDPATGQIDLSGVVVRDADKRNLGEIADAFDKAAVEVRAGKDEEKEKARKSLGRIPGWLIGYVLDLVSFLTYTLNLDMRWAGLPKDPFGSVMVTNVGSLGIEQAWAPLVAYSRVPLIIAMGAVQKEAVVADDDTIRIARRMHLCVTFDHRILDGAHAGKMSKLVRKWFDNPREFFGPIPDPA
jgi:pyruvate dehydrogenase E2 component (dihydrolipoamide acetyltransferase)